MKKSYHRFYASARGYVRSGRPYAEKYSGRYGNGIKIHRPSNEGFHGSVNTSNRYHAIVYVLDDDCEFSELCSEYGIDFSSEASK